MIADQQKVAAIQEAIGKTPDIIRDELTYPLTNVARTVFDEDPAKVEEFVRTVLEFLRALHQHTIDEYSKSNVKITTIAERNTRLLEALGERLADFSEDENLLVMTNPLQTLCRRLQSTVVQHHLKLHHSKVPLPNLDGSVSAPTREPEFGSILRAKSKPSDPIQNIGHDELYDRFHRVVLWREGRLVEDQIALNSEHQTNLQLCSEHKLCIKDGKFVPSLWRTKISPKGENYLKAIQAGTLRPPPSMDQIRRCLGEDRDNLNRTSVRGPLQSTLSYQGPRRGSSRNAGNGGSWSGGTKS